MKSRFARCSAVLIITLTLSSSVALATPAETDVEEINRTAKEAYAEGKYAFCTEPARPLGMRQKELCELAAEIEGCRGFLDACHLSPPPKERSWIDRLAEWLAPIAKVLLYVLVIGIVLVVALPVVRAILKRRREAKLVPGVAEEPNRALVIETPAAIPEEISDAEAVLRLAGELRARGELKRALGLYLAASLSALDRRGAIRIARHRTNGEYVRSCQEASARPPLREIVREVDKVEFGGEKPTDETLARVSTRAEAIVRAAATSVALLMLTLGCSTPRRGADPAGDELPIAVLERNGFKVRPLETSLATMPIPEDEAASARLPVVIVDVEKVPLEDEAQAHMMRWVEAGGSLVLLGHVTSWPKEIRPSEVTADTRDLVVRLQNDERDEEEDDDPSAAPAIEIKGGRTARRDAVAWKDASSNVEPIAFLGAKTYAARRRVGRGTVLGIANDDLFTNVGMMPAQNASALVTLVRSTSRHEVRVARVEDGIPPPSNPFAALVAAGLGKGAVHALAAALVLFLAYGIRQARPRPVGRKERRAFAEHVEATAAFYGRTHAYGHALAVYGKFLDERLHEVIPRGSDPVQFMATRSETDPARVAELYARATSAKAEEPERGDELAVIEELRRIAAKAFGTGLGHDTNR